MGRNPELVANQHSVGQNCFHLTWTPKYRYPLARHPMFQHRIIAAIRVVARRHGIKIIELRVLSDHVHVFVHLPPRMSVSSCVQLLKGATSRNVRRQLPRIQRYKALWSRGYFYRSVGAVTGAVVENYIKQSQGENAYWKQTSLA